MKFQVFTYIFSATLLAACGAKSNQDESLEQLIEKRDSLRRVKTGINADLEKIEAKISERDTTEDLAEVTTFSVTPSTFKHFFTVQANLEATRNAQIYPETQARVIGIMTEEGEKVNTGQPILELDTELIEKNIAEVQTNLDLAEDVFERQERLWEQNIGSEMQYLEAKNRKEQLENRLATLREQRNMTVVKAPFAGIVDNINPKVGEMVNPAMPVARIVNLDDVYLTADVSERYLGRLHVGDSVRVIFPNIDTVRTAISRIGNYISPANRSFEVTIKVPNEGEQLKPNMIAEVKINDYHADSAFTIPTSIVQEDTRGRKFVYLVTNGPKEKTVEKRFVETGRSYEGRMVITKGLKPGDQVVDKGARKVVDGQDVQVLKDREAIVNQ